MPSKKARSKTAAAIKIAASVGGTVRGAEDVLFQCVAQFHDEYAQASTAVKAQALQQITGLIVLGAPQNTVNGSKPGGMRTALMRSCMCSCCIELTQLLLELGVDPCFQTPDGLTALHVSAVEKDATKCKLLIEASAGRAVNLCTGDGAYPLTFAVIGGALSIVQLLHENGADLRAADVLGNTFLQTASQQGHIHVMQYLLQNGAQAGVNRANNVGHTALHKAVQSGSVAAVELLISHGADVTAKTAEGADSMFVAADYGHTALIDLLQKKYGLSVNCTRKKDVTPLIMASHMGDPATVAHLIKAGACVTAVDEEGEAALEFSLLRMCKALPDLQSPSAQVVEEATALRCRLERCALLLIDAGADVLNSSGKGKSCLLLGLLCRSYHIVKALVDHGADAIMNQTFRQCLCCGDTTPWMQCDNHVTLKFLLNSGADVTATTDTGNTALHVAAAHNFPAPCICLLIKAGADLHAVNSTGLTAAEVAHRKGHRLPATLLDRAATTAA